MIGNLEDIVIGKLNGELIIRDAYWLQAKNFVVSFPKSGRTWLESILGEYFAGKEFVKNQNYYPAFSTVFTHDVLDAPLQDLVDYTELEVPFRPKLYEGKKVIYLIRNPRDVLVSYYWQKVSREPWAGERGLYSKDWEQVFNGTMQEFVRDKIFGIPKIVAFMNLWANSVPQKLVVAYEDMRIGTFYVAVKILKHIGVRLDLHPLEEAVHRSEFPRMKARERKRFEGKLTDENQMKTRKGIVGGYKEELDQESIDYVNEYISANLDPYYARYL